MGRHFEGPNNTSFLSGVFWLAFNLTLYPYLRGMGVLDCKAFPTLNELAIMVTWLVCPDTSTNVRAITQRTTSYLEARSIYFSVHPGPLENLRREEGEHPKSLFISGRGAHSKG